MGKVIPFYNSKVKKKIKNKKRNFKTEDGYLLLFYNLYLTKKQAIMLKRIFESQLKVHTGHRKDYEWVLESTLDVLDQVISGTGVAFSIHIYEIYYFEKIIEFEMEMYRKNYNIVDRLIIDELLDIINSFKENNKEYLDEFARKPAEEKYEALAVAWNEANKL